MLSTLDRSLLYSVASRGIMEYRVSVSPGGLTGEQLILLGRTFVKLNEPSREGPPQL